MPTEIAFDMLPVGYTAAAARPPEKVPVRYTEFLSSEDGQEFIRRLEGYPSAVLARLPTTARVNPSQVDHLLAVIRRDRTATVYVNELYLTVATKIGRDIRYGERVFKDDIIDIHDVDPGVPLPADAGLVFVFSVGWRKGMFYDLGPLLPDPSPRPFDPRAAFGHCYAHVLFQERFSITEGEWDALCASKWFPFVGLGNETIKQMLNHLREGWDLDDLTDGVVTEVQGKLPAFIRAWKRHPSFVGHMGILDRAAERFAARDFISCTGLLFPRIEGILRSNHAAGGAPDKPSQENLCMSAVRANAGRGRCLLLPRMFERYLREVYFASFDPKDASIDVSRNSIGHGVAAPSAFTAQAAVVGLLVIHQLFHCFELPSRNVTNEEGRRDEAAT
jgi:hypothetical protein